MERGGKRFRFASLPLKQTALEFATRKEGGRLLLGGWLRIDDKFPIVSASQTENIKEPRRHEAGKERRLLLSQDDPFASRRPSLFARQCSSYYKTNRSCCCHHCRMISSRHCLLYPPTTHQKTVWFVALMKIKSNIFLFNCRAASRRSLPTPSLPDLWQKGIRRAIWSFLYTSFVFVCLLS